MKLTARCARGSRGPRRSADAGPWDDVGYTNSGGIR